MNEPLVVLNNLSKTAALFNITATIPPGKIVALAGPDGAGKTTLIRLMAGLVLPSSGTVTVVDSIGYMPQKFGLYEDLTVQHNLDLYADLRGVFGQERQQTFENLLQFTALAPFTQRLAKDLSGGMKQKLGLACALLQKPQLLLLDEPTVGVDPISRRQLWNMMTALLDEGISIVWSTAYLSEVEKCHSVLLLNEGKLLYDGPPGELTEKMRGRVFKVTKIQGSRRKLLFQLLDEKNVIDGTIQGSDLRIVTQDKTFTAKGDFEVQPQAPRFEDAFIDILGGGPGSSSKLADQRATVDGASDIPVIADQLTKTFGSFTAASDISFQIKKGEIFGLLGPNGAGKSTTFKMLSGLLQPTSGKALVNGVDFALAPQEAKSQLGYMAQKFSLYSMLTVQENLAFFAGAYNTTFQAMVPIFSLENYLKTPAESLPLGYKQRLSLACASLHQPPLLFLDEPTSGVDPITRREFWNHINGLVEKGVTVLVTTHFMDEAEYCDRIALIYRGKMIQIDTPDGLKATAATPDNPTPTLEEAFIHHIEAYDAHQ